MPFSRYPSGSCPCQVSLPFELRHFPAGSLSPLSRIEFVSYRLVVLLRLLPTPPHDDAVAVEYGPENVCPVGTFTLLFKCAYERTRRTLRGPIRKTTGAGATLYARGKMRDNVSDPATRTVAQPVQAALDLSILIPVFNEEESLRPLYENLTRVLGTLKESYEILIVDDGSTDGSLLLMRELEGSDHQVRVLEFVRNFGQTAAMAAGFEYARGKILIPLDGDLQNDPKDIPRILSKLEEGYDVVSCWRYPRRDSLLRTLLSRGANWMISRSTGVRLHDYGCTLKGYRRDITQHIRLYGEMHRFIPVYASWAGARVTELQVSHTLGPTECRSTGYCGRSKCPSTC